MNCDLCAHKAEHGWWGDADVSHCAVCHATWTGLGPGHCTGCHNTFASDSAAKRHSCDIDPGTLTNKAGDLVLTASDRGWRLAGESYWATR